jgi:Holliday junction resolvase
MGEGKESGMKEMRSTLSGFGQCKALFVDVVAMTGMSVCCVCVYVCEGAGRDLLP